jgi:hypothetical protein
VWGKRQSQRREKRIRKKVEKKNEKVIMMRERVMGGGEN